MDSSKLLEHLRRLDVLRERLQETPADQILERRTILERLGSELDTARRVIRPYFDK